MRTPQPKPPLRPSRLRLSLATFALALGSTLGVTGAQALSLDTGNQDFRVRFDNTFKLSTIYRLHDADEKLTDSFRLLVPGVAASAFPQALNFNAGDDNFRDKGFVSKRFDLLSELDLVYKRRYGLRLSGAAWYDAVYQDSSDAADPVNGQSPIDEFPESTRRIAGDDAELLDAFLFGSWDLGGKRLSVRLGQHALQYGESLFYGDNGIARAQGPVDINKLLASPNAQFKEIIRPVEQLSGQLQISPDLSIGAYLQFEWEADRLPPSGSYFSTANIPWGSSQAEIVSIPSGPIAGNYVLTPGGDDEPKDTGQFGLQLKWHVEQTDLGFYLARYHDKGGQLYSNLNVFNPTDSRWYYVFPEAVKTAGISASHTFGQVNFAAEASVRHDMPLRNANIIYPSAFGPAPQYATGKTAHINLSWLASLNPNFLARESDFIGELAWNRVLSYDDPDQELDNAVTRSASAIQFVYKPTYRQVLPGLDLSVPVGLRYTLNGFSSVTVWDPEESGSATLGVEGNYLGVWQFTLTYTHYMGDPVPFVDFSPILSGESPQYGEGNALADRDHIAISLRRTF